MQRLLHGRLQRIEIERLAGFDTDALHLRNDRLIGAVGRMQLEQLGGIGEVVGCRHRIDLELGWGFHVDGWIDFHTDRLGCLTQARERCHGVAGLDLVHGGIVCRAIGLGPPYHPDIGGGRLEPGEPCGYGTDPAWRRHQELSGPGPGGAPPR
ncbi:hypothetical protein D3C84_750880 [compost metagenome]